MDGTNDLKTAGGALLGIGILTFVLGLLMAGAPFFTGLAVALSVGILLLLGGIARVVYSIKSERGFASVAVGLLTVVCGLIMIGHPVFGLKFLTLLVALWFLSDGILAIAASFSLKPQPGWGLVLFGGLVSFLLGFMIWSRWPLSGVWAVGLLIGIRMIFEGWSMVMVGLAVRAKVSS